MNNYQNLFFLGIASWNFRLVDERKVQQPLSIRLDFFFNLTENVIVTIIVHLDQYSALYQKSSPKNE